MTALLVFLGAMVGAPLRYLTDRAVQRRHQADFPWGTFSVNIVGSLVLGGLIGAGGDLSPQVLSLMGTGFCGALTTYSTFSYETFRLLEKREYLSAIANVVGSVMLGVLAAFAGYQLVHSVTG